jgi:MarR family transcriptional regulator, organic hydroperoxide resistance regulator
MKTDDDMPIGHLFANLCRLQATRADQLMDQIGLYRGQAILLVILAKQEGLTHSEIAEKLRISPSAATKVIKRLEKLNYLQRQPDPVDERLSRVYLKDEARAVIDQIHAAFRKIDRVMVAGINPEEQEQLRVLLGRVQANLEER